MDEAGSKRRATAETARGCLGSGTPRMFKDRQRRSARLEGRINRQAVICPKSETRHSSRNQIGRQSKTTMAVGTGLPGKALRPSGESQARAIELRNLRRSPVCPVKDRPPEDQDRVSRLADLKLAGSPKNRAGIATRRNRSMHPRHIRQQHQQEDRVNSPVQFPHTLIMNPNRFPSLVLTRVT